MSVEEVSFREYVIAEVEAYEPSTLAADVLLETGAFTISGIVAGGKGTVCDILKSRDFCAVSISHTTRDVENRDRQTPENPDSYPIAYTFVDLAHMAGKIGAKEMLEVASVHGGNIYGTSLEALQTVASSGRRPLLEIDMQGVEKLKMIAPKMSSFFIVPPTLNEWINRWSKRDPQVSEEMFTKRAGSALKECETAVRMAYDGSIILISNVAADVAADSIIVALEGGIEANQAARLLALRDFQDELAERAESGQLWTDFQRSSGRT